MSPVEGADDLLVVAGEASGDAHAAELLLELKELHPNVKPFGLGGSRCEAAGLMRLARSSEIAVVGITEVLRILSRAREIFHALLAEVDRRGAKTAVLVDFPDFNLRLAKALEKRGVRVVYYVSPQVWAWRKGRVKTIARVVDRMLVLFGFEEEFYRRHGVEVTHVGHPLVDQVPELPRESPFERPGPQRLCLLPGSRRSEIRVHLPLMSEAARRLSRDTDLEVSWIVADEIDPDEFSELVPADLDLTLVAEDRFQTIVGSDLALCASGTATLEVGLLGTPMVVVYKVSRLSSWVGRLVLSLPNISLVNLVLGREVVPEVLQGEATPEGISTVAAGLLSDPQRLHNTSQELGALRPQLGSRGASERAARVVKSVMTSERGEPT